MNDDGGRNGAFRSAVPTPGTDERIRARAYQLYVERGGAPGHEVEDWLRAESEQRDALDATQSDSESMEPSDGLTSRFTLGSKVSDRAREHRSNDFS